MERTMSIREVIEGGQEVGFTERPVYTWDTTNLGGAPTSPAIVVYLVTANDVCTDKTSTVMPAGTVTINGNIISWKPFVPIAIGDTYLAVMTATVNGMARSNWVKIVCAR
jgi:hypothetical protein